MTIHMHIQELIADQSRLYGIEGTACLLQVSVSSMSQGDDGIFYSNMGLVRKLQGVK